MRAELAAARTRWRGLDLYEKFEHAVVLILTGLIAVVVVVAVWHLTLKIVLSLVLSEVFDPRTIPCSRPCSA